MYDVYSGQKNEKVTMKVDLDITNLVCSTYKMRYTFFLKDDYGNNHDIDFANGLCFEISNKNDDIQMNWNIKQWGYIVLPQPKSINIVAK